MRWAFVILMATLMAAALSTPAFAQYDAFQTWNVFAANHPRTAQQIEANPSLINNENYVEHHSALNQFLLNHPGVRRQFQANPQGFLNGWNGGHGHGWWRHHHEPWRAEAGPGERGYEHREERRERAYEHHEEHREGAYEHHEEQGERHDHHDHNDQWNH